MGYKFLEDVAIADVAFVAEGKTLDQMMNSSAIALTSSMIKDIAKIEIKKTVKIKIESKNEEQLLHDFLQELIFLKDAKLLLFREFEIQIEKKDKFFLKAQLKGEKIDMKKHELLVDVKAVSFHRFEVKKEKNGWKCFVILDV
jgi:SHS2 domain-containing protein